MEQNTVNIDDELLKIYGKDDTESNFTIIDEELDPIKCSLDGSMCVELNTEGLTYVTLNIENLHELIQRIEDYENENK